VSLFASDKRKMLTMN